MTLINFDSLRRYAEEACLDEEVVIVDFACTKRTFSIKIKEPMFSPRCRDGEPPIEQQISDLIAQELGRRGWPVDVWVKKNGYISISLRK